MKATSLVLLALTAVIVGWAPPPPVSVSQAINSKRASVKFTAKGDHSGKCAQMEVTNLTKSQVQVELKSGEMLNSTDESEQDLLVVHDQTVEVSGGAKNTIDVEGFCCQLSRSSPDKGKGFKIDKPKKEDLRKLCSYLHDKLLPMDAIQEAIWCVSDDASPSNIDGGKTPSMKVKVEALRKYVCELLKKPDPWYTTPQERIVTPERQIVDNPVVIYGGITYTLDEAKPLDAEVRNESNEVIMSMPDKSPPRAGTFVYNFKLRIQGFPKGKYHVLLKTGGTQIMDKEFVL